MVGTKDYPKEKALRLFWAPKLAALKGFSSADELCKKGVCFACGISWSSCQRSHITPASEGGNLAPDNLHMLCHVCHKDSEYLDGTAYWKWFWERTPLDALFSMMARSGTNLYAFMKQHALLSTTGDAKPRKIGPQIIQGTKELGPLA